MCVLEAKCGAALFEKLEEKTFAVWGVFPMRKNDQEKGGKKRGRWRIGGGFFFFLFRNMYVCNWAFRTGIHFTVTKRGRKSCNRRHILRMRFFTGPFFGKVGVYRARTFLSGKWIGFPTYRKENYIFCLCNCSMCSVRDRSSFSPKQPFTCESMVISISINSTLIHMHAANACLNAFFFVLRSFKRDPLNDMFNLCLPYPHRYELFILLFCIGIGGGKANVCLDGGFSEFPGNGKRLCFCKRHLIFHDNKKEQSYNSKTFFSRFEQIQWTLRRRYTSNKAQLEQEGSPFVKPRVKVIWRNKDPLQPTA